MASKKSVSTRSSPDVTKSEKWRDNFDPAFLEFLTAYGASEGRRPLKSVNAGGLIEVLQLLAVRGGIPDPPMAPDAIPIKLEAAFLDALRSVDTGLADSLSPGLCEVPGGLAVILEAAQNCFHIFEADLKTRVGACLTFGFLYRIARPFWDRLRLEQFGNRPLDEKEALRLIAMSLEIVAKLLRGQWKPKKGRSTDVELLELVNLIQQQSSGKLTPQQIREVLRYAGIAAPDHENWRVWLHRARRQGLVEEQSDPIREIEVPIAADGSIDWAALDSRTRIALRRALGKSSLADP